MGRLNWMPFAIATAAAAFPWAANKFSAPHTPSLMLGWLAVAALVMFIQWENFREEMLRWPTKFPVARKIVLGGLVFLGGGSGYIAMAAGFQKEPLTYAISIPGFTLMYAVLFFVQYMAVPRNAIVRVNERSYAEGRFMLWPWLLYDVEVFKSAHPVKFSFDLSCADGTYRAHVDTALQLNMETVYKADPRTLWPLSTLLNEMWLADTLRRRAKGKTLAEALPLLTEPVTRYTIPEVRWNGKGLSITIS